MFSDVNFPQYISIKKHIYKYLFYGDYELR